MPYLAGGDGIAITLNSWLNLNTILAEAERWPLRDKINHYSCTALTAGLSNRSYLLSRGEDKLVVRINSPHQACFGIDRKRELSILNRVGSLGFAPKVVYADSRFRYLVYIYIEGSSWQHIEDSKRDYSALKERVKQLQSLDIELPEFNYCEHLKHYWQQLLTLKLASRQLQLEWERFEPQLEAWQQQSCQAVLCHHDLCPANIIQDEAQLYLLDWEYAALGHPEFDYVYSGSASSDPGLADCMFWLDRLWTPLHELYLHG